MNQGAAAMPLLFLCLHMEPNRAKYIQVYTGIYRFIYPVIYSGCVSICVWNHLRCTICRSFCGLNSTWFQCTCNGVHMTSSRCNHDCMALSSPCRIHKLATRCWCCAQSMYCSNMNTLFTIRLSNAKINASIRRGAAGKSRANIVMRDRTKYIRRNKHANKLVD